MGPKGERLTVGNDGWVRYEAASLPARVHVRFSPAPDGGRLQATDVHVSAAAYDYWSKDSFDVGLRADVLRVFPLGRIEAWVNRSEVAEVLRSQAGERWESEALASGMRYAFDRHLVPDDAPVFKTSRSTLTVPTSRARDDAFYRAVADRYSAAATQSRGPARLLAEANDVPVSTIHGWVKEARRRGFLGQGQRGKAN